MAPICRHLQVRAQPSCSLQCLYLRGGTAGWWGQDQICNLSVLLSCSEGAPCAGGGGVHRMGDTLGRTLGHWTRVKSPLLASRKTGRASWEAAGCARAWEQQELDSWGLKAAWEESRWEGILAPSPGTKAKGTGNKCISNI